MSKSGPFKKRQAMSRLSTPATDPGDSASARLAEQLQITGAKRRPQLVRGTALTSLSKQHLHHVFKTVREGILIGLAETGAITDANPWWLKIFGYAVPEIVGKDLWDLISIERAEDQAAILYGLRETGHVHCECVTLRTKDERRIDVEFEAQILKTNHDNLVLASFRDLSERQAFKRCEDQLRQARKMEAIGRLAGGVAHDFNNLLGVILGCCDLLKATPGVGGEGHRLLLELHKAGTTAANLTKHLLTFSRRQVLRPVALDLNEIVRRAGAMLSRFMDPGVEIVSKLDSGIGTILADPIEIEQVLMNLVINARDAMPLGGRITIRTENVTIDETYAFQHPYTGLGPYIMLTVSDTGSGMDRKTQSRIFEPFFTTKGPEKGTGLGLSTVFSIVKRSGGMISVYSEIGRGTTFKIYLPRHNQDPAPMGDRQAYPLRGGNETILLVDDASQIRALTRLLLEDCGYMVVDTGDPAEALRIASGFDGPLPLMITDVDLPGFSGSVLAQRLASILPDIRVLYISGHLEDEIASLHVPDSGYEFLEKPFSRDDLIRGVRRLLDAS